MMCSGPKDATPSALIRALDGLPENNAWKWLEAHSDMKADLQARLTDVVEILDELFAGLPDPI